MPSNAPLFSVIMPCYNSQNYVRDALDSLLAQTCPDWQVFTVNDGSTDNTPEILETYAQKDTRIRVLTKQNGGYASAVNMGLDYIEGEYFLFMGSDDRLCPQLLQTLKENIETLSFRPDLVAFRTLRVVDGTITGVDKFTNFDTTCAMEHTSLKEYSESYPAHAAIFSCRDTSRCYKRELLGELRYFGKYGVDADGIFSMMFCHQATSFMSVACDGYLWTLRSDSVSASMSTEKLMDALNNWRLFYDDLTKYDHDRFTQAEKRFVDRYFGHCLGFCADFKAVKKHPAFIRDHLRNAKALKENHLQQPLSARQKLAAACPLLYAALRKVYSILSKR